MPRILLKPILKRQKLSVRRLSKLLNISYSNCFKLMRPTYNPSFKRMCELAALLNVRVRDLIGDDPKPRKKPRPK